MGSFGRRTMGHVAIHPSLALAPSKWIWLRADGASEAASAASRHLPTWDACVYVCVCVYVCARACVVHRVCVYNLNWCTRPHTRALSATWNVCVNVCSSAWCMCVWFKYVCMHTCILSFFLSFFLSLSLSYISLCSWLTIFLLLSLLAHTKLLRQKVRHQERLTHNMFNKKNI